MQVVGLCNVGFSIFCLKVIIMIVICILFWLLCVILVVVMRMMVVRVNDRDGEDVSYFGWMEMICYFFVENS